MSVLVIAEQLRGELRDVTRELVTAAQELEGPVTLAVIAHEPARIDAGIAGVDEIVQVDVEPDEFENDVYQEAVEALIRERRPHVVLAGFTVNSMGYAAAVAVKLGLGFASDVHALRVEDGELVATRSFYGAKVNGDVDFPGKETVLLLLRPTAWAPDSSARVSTTLVSSRRVSASKPVRTTYMVPSARCRPSRPRRATGASPPSMTASVARRRPSGSSATGCSRCFAAPSSWSCFATTPR